MALYAIVYFVSYQMSYMVGGERRLSTENATLSVAAIMTICLIVVLVATNPFGLVITIETQ